MKIGIEKSRLGVQDAISYENGIFQILREQVYQEKKIKMEMNIGNKKIKEKEAE